MILGAAGGAPDAVGAALGAAVGAGGGTIFFFSEPCCFGSAVVLVTGRSSIEGGLAEGTTVGTALAAGPSSIEDDPAEVAAGADALPGDAALRTGSGGACWVDPLLIIRSKKSIATTPTTTRPTTRSARHGSAAPIALGLDAR